MFASAWGSLLDRRVLCTLTVSIAAFGIPQAVAAQSRPAEVLGVQKIWEAAPHNAFTDLIWHEGRFWCVFREGARHVSPDGALRVLSSQDGKSWSSAALIKRTDADLRDAKITVAPGG
jgi:hypothetical protein